MEIQIPLIAILVIGILILVYLRKTLPQLYSSRVFFVFLIFSAINVIAEIFECLAFIRLDEEYSDLRRITKIIYVVTLLICTYLVMLYSYSKITIKKNMKMPRVLMLGIPLMLGVLSVVTSEIFYGMSRENQDIKWEFWVDLGYVAGFFYIVITFGNIILFRKRLRKDDFLGLFLGLVIWTILACYQFFFGGVQVTSVAIMMMALLLFVVIENPKESFEKLMPNVMNYDAFSMYLLELFGLKKKFYVVSIVFTGKSNLLNVSERKELRDLQKELADLGQNILHTSAYLSEWNTISFVTEDPAKVELFMNSVNGYRYNGNYKITFVLIEIPKCTDKYEEAIQLLSYVSEEYVFTQSSPNLVIDEGIVDDMIYRNDVEDIVRNAVIEKAFDVYYQPILNVADGSFSSAEALVRLRRPDSENYISPDVFIPIAEKCGFVQDIDDLVFEKVCSFIARENLNSYGLKTIEVNLSGNEVVDHRAFDRLISKMEKYKIPPKLINFEITETAYISNDDVFKENVRKLKEAGSTFSMDDFGAGYSNLLELLKMDYILVKLDKEFVWKCLDSDKPENMKMLRYTIDFLKEYGLHILAEGVENLDQAEILIENGVEYLQGFYYSRPITEKDYIEFLKAQNGLMEANLKGEGL